MSCKWEILKLVEKIIKVTWNKSRYIFKRRNPPSYSNKNKTQGSNEKWKPFMIMFLNQNYQISHVYSTSNYGRKYGSL